MANFNVTAVRHFGLSTPNSANQKLNDPDSCLWSMMINNRLRHQQKPQPKQVMGCYRRAKVMSMRSVTSKSHSSTVLPCQCPTSVLPVWSACSKTFVADMISMTTEQNYYLYPKPMDTRKGIDRLAEIVRTEMLHDPYIINGVYVFMSRDLRKIKVLSRGLRRFELTLIRLDEEKFILPVFDDQLCCYKISWSDFVQLTEDVQKWSVIIKNILILNHLER